MSHKQLYLYFPFWRKQYFFSKEAHKNSKLANMCVPYNFFARITWKVWNNFSIFRSISRAYEDDLPIPLKEIYKITGIQSDLDFIQNTGTSGPDQKSTAVVYSHDINRYFFIKYSKTKRGNILLRNEVNTLSQLPPDNIYPKIINYSISDEYCWYMSSYISGEKLLNNDFDINIYNLLLKINKLNINTNNSNKADIKYVFSHGDFCPWNILLDSSSLKIIDWEMASYLPLGYDLFTFIFQSNFLLNPTISASTLLVKNKYWIIKYFKEFGIINWEIYLNKYIEWRIKQMGNHLEYTKILLKYNSLLEQCNIN
ncbi:phosphotransferase [Larkinella bovis]|uniref:Phosphotransferase n=1 Tax=Larkinella bovis TaxID=683041 RepID=A0ABW0IGE8_9BACT